jgi:hypothetical protein
MVEEVSALGVSNFTAVVQVEDGTIRAFARIETSLPDAQKTWLDHPQVVQLEKVSANEFKWVFPEKKNKLKIFSLQDIHVHFDGGSILVGQAQDLSRAKTIASKQMDRTLLNVSVNLTPLFEPVGKIIEEIIAGQEDGFGKAMLDGMWKSVHKKITAVQDLPVVELKITSTETDTLKMRIGFCYKTSGLAEKMQTFFSHSKGAWKNPALTEQQLSLLKLTASPHFVSSDLQGNHLSFLYKWSSLEDSKMLELVSQSLLGGLVSMHRPATFPLNSKEAIPAPEIRNMESFSATQFEKNIRKALFFTHCWSSSVDFTIDYIDLPNIDFLKTALTNVCVMTVTGENVAKKTRAGRLGYNSSDGSMMLSLALEKTKKKLSKASFTLRFDIPTKVKKYTLSAQNTCMEDGDSGLCLTEISNSVVNVRSHNLSLSNAKIYARDATGDYLRKPNSSWTRSNFRAEFNGMPATVEIVFPVKTETVEITFVDFPISAESEIKMPSNPTNSIITRYSMKRPQKFIDLDRDALMAGTMSYVTNAGWKKNGHELRFPKQNGVEVGNQKMKAYLAGTDQFMAEQNGVSSYSAGSFKWTLRNTNALDQATALWGAIDMTFWSGIETYSVNVTTNPTPLNADKRDVTASVEHNVVWIGGIKDYRILSIQAFDASGQQLKKGNQNSGKSTTLNGVSRKSRGYFFWGQPTRTVVTLATKKETVYLPFQIELKPGGLKDILAIQPKVAHFEEICDTLRFLNKNNTYRYGMRLAANYYATNYQNKPTAKIPLEMAQADRESASIFGYEAKPYKGYYFKKLPTAEELKRKMPFETYKWAGGTFQAKSRSGVILALPVNPSDPTIMLVWGNLYVNYSDCSKLKQVDLRASERSTAGWIQVQAFGCQKGGMGVAK